MQAAQPRNHVSPEDYLAYDRDAEIRHEYVDGEVIAMSGGTGVHSMLAAQVGSALLLALQDRPCIVFTADMRVAAGDDYFYPDVSVACGPRAFEEAREDILREPVLIVEVLSASSEGYDRGRKFASYQRIPTLMHYILVAQREVRVEHFRRTAGENAASEWQLRVMGTGHTLEVLDCRIDVDDLYRKALQVG